MNPELSARELATILAALRFWQRSLEAGISPSPLDQGHFDDQIPPLTSEEIDELCERLNFA